MHLAMSKMNVSNTISLGEEPQLSVLRLNCAQTPLDSQGISFPAAGLSWRPAWGRFAAFSPRQPSPRPRPRGSSLRLAVRTLQESSTTAVTYSGEGSRPSWELVGRGIGPRGQEQIRGLLEAAPAIHWSYCPAGTAGSGRELAQAASADLSARRRFSA